MTTAEPDSGAGSAWQRQLLAAAACAVVGVVVHQLGVLIPVQLAVIGLGIGVIGAAFMLGWAADAGDAVFSGGLVLAGIALLAVLPEFTIEVRFAFTQQADLVTANLTGATRLLLTGATALPILVAFLARRKGEAEAPLELGPNRRLELGILLVVAIFAIKIATLGSVTVFDSVFLLGLYALYARKVQGTPDEEAAVVGVAAGLMSLPARYQRPAITVLIAISGYVILTIANPFADALLATGTSLGFDPYLLIQSVVPAATEAPEFVIVAVLVANQRPAQGFALFLASSLSQWTLGLGALPLAFLAGGGGPSMPLAGREQLELGFTITLTLFVVASLATLRPEPADAYLMVGVYVMQLIYPTPFMRFAAGFVLLVFAIDLFFSHHRFIGPLLRAGFGGSRPWRRRRARPTT